MKKQALSLMCCLLPFGAGATEILIDKGTDPVVFPDGVYTSLDTNTVSYYVKSASGIVVNNGTDINITHNMFVGQDSGGSLTNGDLYIGQNISQAQPFTVLTTGDVSIGTLLTVVDGYSLALGSHAENVRNINIGASDDNTAVVVAKGALAINAGNDVNISGSVASRDDLVINADNISTGSINTSDGNTTINAAGTLKMAQFINANETNPGTNTTIKANKITSGTIQNQSGVMKIGAPGGLDVSGGSAILGQAGSIYSTGKSLEINDGNFSNPGYAGDVNVAGVIKNDRGELNIKANSLNVMGGDASNQSLVLKQTDRANIMLAGPAHFEHGIDLTEMKNTNNFSFMADTLTFGDNVDDNYAWKQLSENNLKNFEVTLKSGDILANIIKNGVSNSRAVMALTGRTISGGSVENHATLRMLSTGGDINIAGGVYGANGSDTNILSKIGDGDDLKGDIIVGGVVSNSGKMVLNAKNITTRSITNDGISLKVDGSTSDGALLVNGNVTNTDGDVLLRAAKIDITDTLTNTNGTTTVKGVAGLLNDVNIGAVSVDGGVVNISQLGGGVAITNDSLNVNGGVVNIDGATRSLTAQNNINIAGDLVVDTADAVAGHGDVYADADTGLFKMVTNEGDIQIKGNITAVKNDKGRNIQLVSNQISVDGDVDVQYMGRVILGDGDSHDLQVRGDMAVTNNGTVDIYASNTVVNSLTNGGGNTDGKIIARGNQIVAKNGVIDIHGNVMMNDTDAATGLVVRDTNDLTLNALNSDINISEDIDIASDKSLKLKAGKDINVLGSALNAGTLIATAQNIQTGNVTNIAGATVNLDGDQNVQTADINNDGYLTINADTIRADDVTSNGGTLDINGASPTSTFSVADLSVSGGVANIAAAQLDAARITVDGNLVQGNANTGRLNITNDNSFVTANTLTVGGNLLANSKSVTYDVKGTSDITGDVVISNVARADISTNVFKADNINNAGELNLLANNGIDLTGAINNNGGFSYINSGRDEINASSFKMNGGTAQLVGAGLNATGDFQTAGTLYQNSTDAISNNDVNIRADKYTLAAGGIDVGEINQQSGQMFIKTSDLAVAGDIKAKDLYIAANPSTDWMTVAVDGDVSGGVSFIGLKDMTIGGNYIFDQNSAVNAAILPYAAGDTANTTTHNYWASVSLNNDNTLGVITNAADATPLISVNGKMTMAVESAGDAAQNTPLASGQIGINLYDVVDQGTAIWLAHADNGLEELGEKIRNLQVNFCNADGTKCFEYFGDDAVKNADNGGTENGLPAYLATRDINGDGTMDSLYIVFDPRFGGPIRVFKIQPVVERVNSHTAGEYAAAGALDNLIAGGLSLAGFNNNATIEAIPVAFQGTKFETLASEIYDRMAAYNLYRDGASLMNFSHLFQPREIEQLVGNMVLNDHANYRSFENRMLDEFIWNRNRSLKKLWADIDLGMFDQDLIGDVQADGKRFNVTIGYDWQYDQTVVLGVAARFGRMSSDVSEDIDLSYIPGQSVVGNISSRVADTNIGLGGYMMKILGDKTRLYGNVFLDAHMMDAKRDQTYLDQIKGHGTSFALTSEWGILHDWMNQYVVGNMYARVGYNTGFSIKEKMDGDAYMNLKYDGFMKLVPGYSLTFQKRVYPSAWTQLRPYATVGVEYDVLGASDSSKYKFALSNAYTDYDLNIDPLWAYAGAGVQLLYVYGGQVGLDYRFQYNDAIRMHNIRLSGSYRF